MELFALFTTAFLVGFSGAVVPGPLLTVTISETVKRGIIAGPLLVAGHGLLEVLIIVGLIFGLGEALHNETIGSFLSIVGGAVLLWMGYGIIRDTLKGKIKLNTSGDGIKEAARKRGNLFSPLVSGVVTSVANPYWTLWWITVGASFLQKSLGYSIFGVSLFFSGHILADFVWYTLVSFIIVTGKNFLSEKIFRVILIFSGLFLGLIAVSFIYMGIVGTGW